MQGDGREELWKELAEARRRVAELEALLPGRTHDVNPPTAALRDALAGAGVGLWEWQIDSGELRWSDGIERLFGLGPGEFDGRYETYLSLLGEEARKMVTDAIEQAFAGGDDYHVEHAIVPRGGVPKWVVARGQVFRDASGQPKALVGLVADVSARKELQERQRESEERFKAFASSSFEGIAFSIDGAAMDVNDNLCRILGCSRSEVIGENVARFVHPDDLELVRGKMRSGDPDAYRHRIIRRDGTIGHVETRGRHVTYRGRQMRMTSLRDVTEQVHLAEEHQRLAEQLLAAQKMEAIGQLAGGVAHDFNNIMMVMLGNLTMAVSDLEEGKITSEVKDGLQDAITSGKRAVELVAQLLAYSRRQPQTPKSVSLPDQLRSLSDMLKPVIPENLRIEIELEDDLPCAYIDPGQLQQVLMNLALNGRDAMPEGGRLTLGAARIPGEHEWQPPRPLTSEGPLIRIWVADEGEGIAAEQQPRIFEPFFTTKPPGKGTGLGLSTAYGIVKQAGGEIFVESTLGKGATFSLLLPVSTESPAGASPSGRKAVQPQQSGTVLVCEDNAGVRRFIVRVLKAAGLAVLEAGTGADAERCAAKEGRIDLLIADMVLPDTGGAKLAEKIRGAHPEAKVLLTSGYSEELQELSQSQSVASLPKPFSGDELLRKVKELLHPRRASTPASN